MADFNWRMLLGKNKLKIVQPLARRLNNEIEGCRPLYRRLLIGRLRESKVLTKLHMIYENQLVEDSGRTQKQLERVDKIRQDAMNHAKKHC